MSKVYSIHYAKTNLSRLVELACAGEEIVIARGKTPVVKLVPTVSSVPRRQFGAMKGQARVTRAFFEPLPEEELAASAWEITTKARIGKAAGRSGSRVRRRTVWAYQATYPSNRDLGGMMRLQPCARGKDILLSLCPSLSFAAVLWSQSGKVMHLVTVRQVTGRRNPAEFEGEGECSIETGGGKAGWF